MGTVTLWMQTSLDGYTEGPDDHFEWPIVDEELHGYFLDQLYAVDTFLYGRKTFEIMAGFWPTADSDPAISEFYIEYARLWKKMPKVVFSNTVERADWNTRVVRDDLVEEITALKARSDGNLALFGGADIVSTFLQHDLIDEYRLFVHPLLLGGGSPLFPAPVERTNLALVNARTFESEVVHVHYQRCLRHKTKTRYNSCAKSANALLFHSGTEFGHNWGTTPAPSA